MKLLSFLLPVIALTGLAGNARAQAASAGLWVGTVALNKVTDPKAALTPSGGTFEFRIIFHVGTDGKVKLLKDVIVMQRDDDSNANTPPDIVLVTNPARIPRYRGVLRRSDGRLTGIRYAASAYDFTGLDLPATGGIAAESELTYSLVTAENSPTNPFRHKYHPDHETGRTFTRAVTVSFKGATIVDAPAGTKRITGTYKEVISELLKYNIQMAGTVTLDRVSTVGALNP